MPANNSSATEPIPAADGDRESVAGEMSTGDATSTPSLMCSEVAGVNMDSSAIVGTPCSERNDSPIVQTPIMEGASEMAGVDMDSSTIVGTPCSEGVFDSPVVETPISKDNVYIPDTPHERS